MGQLRLVHLLLLAQLLTGCGGGSKSQVIEMTGTIELDRMSALEDATLVFSSTSADWEQSVKFSQVRSGSKEFAEKMEVRGKSGPIQLTVLVPGFKMFSKTCQPEDSRCDFGYLELKAHSENSREASDKPPPALSPQRVTPSHEAYSKPEEPTNLEKLREQAGSG